MSGVSVRLKIIGMGGAIMHTAPIEKLIPEAVEWAGRGYTVALSTEEAPGKGVEIRRQFPDDQFAVATVRPEGAISESWMTIALNLTRTTPLPTRSTPR